MADKEKKRKKKKEEVVAPPPDPEPTPEPVPVQEPAPAENPTPEQEPNPDPDSTNQESTKASSKGSKRSAKRASSSVFSMFSKGQIAEFKEGFEFMDADKDGFINASDLRATFNHIGKVVTDKELDDMLSEAVGPINFSQLLTLFANRMSGRVDDDDVIVTAFRVFDEGGLIDGEKLKHVLMNFGEKMTMKEVDDCFATFEMDEDMMIDTEALLDLIVGERVPKKTDDY